MLQQSNEIDLLPAPHAGLRPDGAVGAGERQLARQKDQERHWSGGKNVVNLGNSKNIPKFSEILADLIPQRNNLFL